MIEIYIWKQFSISKWSIGETWCISQLSCQQRGLISPKQEELPWSCAVQVLWIWICNNTGSLCLFLTRLTGAQSVVEHSCSPATVWYSWGRRTDWAWALEVNQGNIAIPHLWKYQTSWSLYISPGTLGTPGLMRSSDEQAGNILWPGLQPAQMSMYLSYRDAVVEV